MGDKPIEHVVPPWKLKATVYMVSFYNSNPGDLPSIAYSPLESTSPFASTVYGRHNGGLGQFQIIRYTESPVGPYDELIICPGSFDYPVSENGTTVTKKAARITRIYVSQKYTCWNGRKNWNIPKHLAQFEFRDLPDGSTNVKVYPHDTTGDPTEANPNHTPFFQATIKSVPWLPSFPFSLGWLPYIGVDVSIVQPPLPEGTGSHKELVGTNQWCKIVPNQSGKTSLAWIDLSQRDDDGKLHGQHESFWPGLGRWQLGIKMENTDIVFGMGEYWASPAAEPSQSRAADSQL
ncbi:uncharacterized protein BCR38DRAFT_349990 [Pseudomassariella vexata]|uniref:Uncharacterized protein n=1 Tax=Pseudomassariella vexata TaxID=1141098 RepID=A0A1Y2DNQ5_9PEZI|nr:uncharacterized protein BCR38DRAFT_349990 [Pseudomassariella vexata]ORY60285.1 hypothetical protein BCR38DRAFT_349990 [Pseudomassariella vexata]